MLTGIKKIKLDMADSRNYANIEFNDVECSNKSILGAARIWWRDS
jgi:hypothetical protein